MLTAHTLWTLSRVYTNWYEVALKRAVNSGGTCVVGMMASSRRSITRRRDRRLHRLWRETDTAWANINVGARSCHLCRGARLTLAQWLADDSTFVGRTPKSTRHRACTDAEPPTDNTIAIERVDEPHAPAVAPGGSHYFLMHPCI